MTIHKMHKNAVDAVAERIEELGLHIERQRPHAPFDLLVANGKRSPVHIKVYVGDGNFFKIQKKVLGLKQVILIYVWDFYEEPRFFVMLAKEAMKLVGPSAMRSQTWKTYGVYWWSAGTGLPKARREKMEGLYLERWKTLTDLAK